MCREHGIVVIEDCNNAMGALSQGQPVGMLGDYAVHSFYPNRQINAIEGGALTCPDEDSANRARRLRRFGIDALTFRDSMGEINASSDVPELGWSAALNQLNSAIGLAQLRDLAEKRRRTQANAALLRGAIQGLKDIKAVEPLPGAAPVYWAFLVLAEKRDSLLATLKAQLVHASRLHHRNDSYSGFASPNRRLLGTDALQAQILALPCGWWLDEAEMHRLVALVQQACAA